MNPVQMQEFSNLLEELRAGFYTADSIDLTDYGITDDHLEQLLSAIKVHSGINAQIRVLNLSKHSLNFTNIDGLTGLEELILNGKSSTRNTILSLSNLPRLRKLQARLCHLTWLTFQNITTLQEVDLFCNFLKEINLDSQVGLADLILYANRFEKLDFSALHQLKRLDIGSNDIQELYLGNSPLSQGFCFRSDNMSENSKKQLWARYITNSEQMNDYDDYTSGTNDERTTEIKNNVRIKEVTDLAECFNTHVVELKKHKLKQWMRDARCVYAYCKIGFSSEGWDRIPDEIQGKIIAEHLYGLVDELRQRLLAVLEQFESVVPEFTAAFIKDRVEPFIADFTRNVMNHFEQPKFKEVVARLIEDNKNTTTPILSSCCLPSVSLSSVKPITWLAASYHKGVKQFTPRSSKKHVMS